MDKTKKRERMVNFSHKETENLISLIDKYKNIIENKKSDAVTWQEKEKAWRTIETQFNSSGGGAFRSAKHLKLKYEALKRDTRKKSSVIRAGRYNAGGGNDASTLTAVEQKVKEMILFSVERGESNDLDKLEVATSEESGNLDVLAEANIHPVNLEGPLLDAVTADCPNNTIFRMPYKEINKKRCRAQAGDAVPSTSTQVDQDSAETPHKRWAKWKHSSFKSKKHPALCKPKEKRPFDKLAEEKSETAALRKKIFEEEIKAKMLKIQILKEEMEHKNEMFRLEKEQMLLKMEILKIELQNKKM